MSPNSSDREYSLKWFFESPRAAPGRELTASAPGSPRKRFHAGLPLTAEHTAGVLVGALQSGLLRDHAASTG